MKLQSTERKKFFLTRRLGCRSSDGKFTLLPGRRLNGDAGTCAILIMILLSFPLPAPAGGHLGLGVGRRSGTLFRSDEDYGFTLFADYFHNSTSRFAFGGGFAHGWATHFFHRNGPTDEAGITEECVRADVLIHPFNASDEGLLYLGGGPSLAFNKISLETYQQGGGGGGIVFVGNDPFVKWLNNLPYHVTPGSKVSSKEKLFGWHARFGVRYEWGFAELLHEQAIDSHKELGGTYFQFGFVW